VYVTVVGTGIYVTGLSD